MQVSDRLFRVCSATMENSFDILAQIYAFYVKNAHVETIGLPTITARYGGMQ